MVARAPQGEIARVTSGRDITRGWVDGLWWLAPQDRVLRERGRSDHILYEDLLRDDKVWSTHQQRRAALVARETQVLPGGKTRRDKMAAEQLEEVLGGSPWDAITDQMLYATLYGWGVAEVMWMRDGRHVVPEAILPRDRRRFAWRAEDGGRATRWRLLLRTVKDAAGKPLPDRKFWTTSTGADHVDEPYGRGLGHALYWPVWFKRHQTEFWLVALEKFGQPTGVGRYLPTASEADKAKLLEAVKALHTDSGVVVPDSTTIELLERSGGTMDYESFYGRMNDAITQVVLSETMTSEDGSSRSQAEIHMDVRQEIVSADAWLIHDSFRSQVARWIVDWNWPGAAVPILRRVQEEDPDLLVQAERDKLIVDISGRRLSDAYVEETYGVELGEERPAPPTSPGAGAADAEMAWADRPFASRRGSARQRPSRHITQVDLAERQLDRIEQVMAAIDADAWDEMAAPMIEPVLRRAQEDPEALLSDLASVWPEMDVGELAERLARVLFVAQVWGRLEAEEASR